MKTKTSFINTKFAKIITISIELAGQRIDNFLRKQIKHLRKNTIYCIIRKGKVKVNKKRVQPKYKLVVGDKVYIPLFRIIEQEKKMQLSNIKSFSNFYKLLIFRNIIFEDDFILVLNKPARISVHSGSGLSFGIIEILRIIRPTEKFLELVHRLDRNTSGVLLIAKKPSILRSLHDQLRKNKIQKNYLALVSGRWQSHIKTIQAPLLKVVSRKGEKIIQVNEKGKFSETRFKVEERYAFSTLISCTPITGRTHQIRVHTQYAGHPIALDDKYGDVLFNKKLEYTGLTRLFLHSYTLKFIHPYTGKLIKVQAPLDDVLKNCLKLLRIK